MDTSPRTISAREFELVSAWLDHDVDGAASLRKQLDRNMLVRSSCGCGCGSFGFLHPHNEVGVSYFDVDAQIVGPDGEPVGGMMLLVNSGFLHDVEILSYLDEPLQAPDVNNVKFHLR